MIVPNSSRPDAFLSDTPVELDALLKLAASPASSATLYAIIDACDEPAIMSLVERYQSQRQAVSLYRGNAEKVYAAIAPYLFVADEDLIRLIAETLISRPWGFFAVCGLDSSDVRKHWRRFLMVKGPERQDLYFRFYDPRILRGFLETAGEPAVRAFFGPVTSIIANDEDGQWHFFRPSQPADTPATPIRGLRFDDAGMRSITLYGDNVFLHRLRKHLLAGCTERSIVFDRHDLDELMDRELERLRRYEVKRQDEIAAYMEIACWQLNGSAERLGSLAAQNLMFDRRIKPTERIANLSAWASNVRKV